MRVLVIAPNEMLLSILTRVLEREEDIEIAGAVTDHTQVFEYRDQIDIVALQADAPGQRLFEIIRELRGQLPGVKILLLHAPDLQDQMLRIIEAGVAGYVYTHQSVADMLATLRAVHHHGAAIDPNLAALLIERMATLSEQLKNFGEIQFNPDAKLTARQMEVLGLISQGLTNDEIAAQLYISVGTVKNHVHTILQTLGASSRDGAAYWYNQHQQDLVQDLSNDRITRTAVAERLDLHRKRLDWQIGHAFLLDPATGHLIPTNVWSLDYPDRYSTFRQMTVRSRFSSQQGVIGNVLFSPEPIWIADVSTYPDYARSKAARQDGIVSGLVLPLYDSGQLVGALEFYSTRRAQPSAGVVADILTSADTPKAAVSESRGQGDR
ncbi:MAG: LuxR C-terminal-related transcriptional regulator [Thermomicrobiales bacterium]